MAIDLFDIKDFKLRDFDTARNHSPIKNHEFRELSLRSVDSKKNKLLSKEDKKSQESDFNILPVVMEYRGLKKQECEDRSDIIKEKVNEELRISRKEAYREGFETGRREAMDSIREELIREMKGMVENFADDLERMTSEYRKILFDEKYKIYSLIKALTKWVILRELKNDGQYLERMIEKLIQEVTNYSNLVFKIREKDFKEVSEIIDFMKKKFNKIENINIEIIHDEDSPLGQGIVVESENEILNATFKTQFKALDKLFKQLENDDEY